MKPIWIQFFGDSICVGQYISVHHGWVTRISATLAELGLREGCPVMVTNSSQNGRTTREALLRMPYEVQSKSPDILLVQYGLNDCNYWQSDEGLPRVSPDAFAANLAEIIARARNCGTWRILVNTNHPTLRDQTVLPNTTRTLEESNRFYNTIVRDVARRAGDGVLLNDVEETFASITEGDRRKLEELVLPEPDGVHPSEAGHTVYFDAVRPVLTRLVLERLASRDGTI